MPKRLLPRPPTEMGKRGQILAVFGLTWIGMGYALLMDGDPVAWARLEPFEWIPATTRGWAWIATGLTAAVWSLRPRSIASDKIGFLALYLMPAWRVAALLWSWVDSFIDLGGVGYPHGWLWALVHLPMVVAVIVCSNWPEPIVTERDRA